MENREDAAGLGWWCIAAESRVRAIPSERNIDCRNALVPGACKPHDVTVLEDQGRAALSVQIDIGHPCSSCLVLVRLSSYGGSFKRSLRYGLNGPNDKFLTENSPVPRIIDCKSKLG